MLNNNIYFYGDSCDGIDTYYCVINSIEYYTNDLEIYLSAMNCHFKTQSVNLLRAFLKYSFKRCDGIVDDAFGL